MDQSVHHPIEPAVDVIVQVILRSVPFQVSHLVPSPIENLCAAPLYHIKNQVHALYAVCHPRTFPTVHTSNPAAVIDPE